MLGDECSFSFLVTAASFFSAKTQDASPFISPGNSRIRAEEPKPPVSEMPSWTISDRGDSSANVAGSVDDLAAFEHARKQDRVSSPLPMGLGLLQRGYDMDQHQRDPGIDDTLHVDLTPIPTQGTPRSPSPLPGPSGREEARRKDEELREEEEEELQRSFTDEPGRSHRAPLPDALARGLSPTTSTLHTASNSPTILDSKLSACRRLINHTFSPHETVSLIEGIFTSKAEINIIRDLRGDDAQAFVDVVHEVRPHLFLYFQGTF